MTPGFRNIFNILQMNSENCEPLLAKSKGDDKNARQRCGCLRTSKKLRKLLETFPAPPPPTPASIVKTDRIISEKMNHVHMPEDDFMGPEYLSGECMHVYRPVPVYPTGGLLAMVQHVDKYTNSSIASIKMPTGRCRQIARDLVQLLQLAVATTALALYYAIYCYMSLIYYALRTALFFHQADGSMKITIGIMSMTSLLVAFNLILRLQKLIDSVF